MRQPPRALRGAACAALLALSACHQGQPGAKLLDEPWRTNAAGRFAVTADLGVANNHLVDSTLDVQNPNFPVETSELAGSLEGVFAGALGVEYFPVDDLSFGLGAEYRRFDPDVQDEFFSFQAIEQLETFLTARWFLPVRWLESGRLRPFLQGKLAYVPTVKFDMTTDFDLPDPLNDLQLTSPYSGSGYWSLAAGGGLAYQLADALVGRFGVYYEWALGSSQDTIPTTRTNSTGDPTIDEFLDGVFDELLFEVELEPRGWVAYVGLSWYP